MSGLEDFQSSNGVQESSSDDNSSSSSSDSSSDSDSSSEEDTTDKLSEDKSSENTEKTAAAPALELTEGIDLNTEDQNWSSSLDEILDNLTTSGSSSGSHQGPVDPVFVDHEDSQHATHMDSLVFDSQHNFAGDSSSTMDDMNEPRLASVCNSTINSAENSIILGNDFDDGDIMFSDNNLENVLDGGGGAKVNVDDPQQVPSLNQSQGPNISNNAKSCPVSQKVRKKKRKTTQEEMVGSEEKKSKTDHDSNTKGAKVELGKNVSAVIEEAVSPNTSMSSCSSPKEKGKLKLSLKDYKAKKEAEKNLRKQLEISPNEVSLSSSSQGEDNTSLETSEETKIEPDTNANIEDNANVVDMHNFDILDEVESDIEVSKDSNEDDEEDLMGDSEDSLAEEEVDQMLEANVKKKEAQADIEPQEKLTKLVLEDRGQNVFEVLPQGWVTVTHNSGIPLYLHRESRVVTVSKPYDLGNGSVRRHNIPVSAIPCYAYRYGTNKNSEENKEKSSIDPSPSASPGPQSVSGSQKPVPQLCPYSGKESASPDSTTTDARNETQSTKMSPKSSEIPAAAAQSSESVPCTEEEVVADSKSNIFPKAHISSVEDSLKESELRPEEVTKYCKKLFKFKELEVTKFKTWKERRAYLKQSNRKKIETELLNRPTLPEGTKIITIPSLELSNLPGTEGESAINQKVVKKSKKKWIINPAGKSTVCLLHEYVQQSLKTQPYYQFTELDNSATPYAAIVRINDLEYGRGTGSSKKVAKAEAAKKTLEMLIPEIKDKLPSLNAGEEGDAPDLSFFDGILVEDSRVADLCNRTSEPAPYQILVTCLQRNYGLGDINIHQDMKTVRNGKNEYTMIVNKKEVSVICKNKKDGKQLAAQKLLQQLHPHITSWGSLLRMYGNRSLRKLKLKKEKETEVTGLQTRSSASSLAPSLAILNKLRDEMRNLRESKQNIVPIGKFTVALDTVRTGNGLSADHVDL